MNWKNLHEKYPLSFLEWIRVDNPETNEIKEIKENEGVGKVYTTESKAEHPNVIFLDDSDARALPEYFDTLGIHVDAGHMSEAIKVLRAYAENDVSGDYTLLINSMDSKESYSTRLEALKAGIEKAFSIRESQIKSHG